MIQLWLTGLFIGILAGLSMSAVAQTLFNGVFGIAAAITGVLAGVRSDPKVPSGSESKEQKNEHGKVEHSKVSPAPLFWLVFGLALGSIGGLYTRTHNYLGVAPTQVFAALVEAGVNKEKATDWFLNNLRSVNDSSLGILRKSQVDTNDRALITATTGQDFIDALGQCHSPNLKKLSATLSKNHSRDWTTSEIQILESIRDYILMEGTPDEQNAKR